MKLKQGREGMAGRWCWRWDGEGVGRGWYVRGAVVYVVYDMGAGEVGETGGGWRWLEVVAAAQLTAVRNQAVCPAPVAAAAAAAVGGAALCW